MSPTRTRSGALQGGSSCVRKLLHLLPILLYRKLLINKRYSRCSRCSRLINSNICSCRPCPTGAYAHAYKGLARHPAVPAEPAVSLSSQWDKRSRRVAAHPDTCWAYHRRTIETAHSPTATPPGPESIEDCAIAPLHVGTVNVGTVTRKVITSLPLVPRALHRPHERRTGTSLNPFIRTSRRAVGSRPNRTLHHRFGSSLA
jgi:hypothetical protein